MEKVNCINCEKFICDIYKLFVENEHNDILWYFDKALREQGLKYMDGGLYQMSGIVPKFKTGERIRNIYDTSDQAGNIISKVDNEHECYVFLNTSKILEFADQDKYEIYHPCEEGRYYLCKNSYGEFKAEEVYLAEFMSGNDIHMLDEDDVYHIFNLEYHSIYSFSEYFELLDEEKKIEIKRGNFYKCKETFMHGRFTEGYSYYCPKDNHLIDNFSETVGVCFVTQYFIPVDESDFIKHNKWYVCIKDYYAGGNTQAVEGQVVQAKRGMYMMGLKEDRGKEYFRRWKITDIKDGDIVTFSDNSHAEEPFIGIFKGWYADEGKKMKRIACYAHITTFGGTLEIDTCEEEYWNAYNIEPATIEETNLLFDTLKENGFIWNSEKRKLEKVPDVTINTNAEKKINVEHLVKSYLMTKPQVVTTEECYRQGIMDVIDLLKKGWRI